MIKKNIDIPSIPHIAAVLSTDTKNVGDENSNPILYFSFGRDVERVDWPTIRKSYRAQNLIVGGGFISKMFDDNPNYFSLANEVKNVIAWGIGHDPHKPLGPKTLERCALVGLREYGHPGIDNKKVFYVPCASCMSPLFDLNSDPIHEHVFFLHSHVSSIEKNLGLTNQPVMKNRMDFVSTIRFLSSGKVVVTNSYHGAYYATLLGRKVVVIAEPGQWDGFRPEKFECFKFPPAFSSSRDWKGAALTAKNYFEALADSRRENISFYQKAINLMWEK